MFEIGETCYGGSYNIILQKLVMKSMGNTVSHANCYLYHQSHAANVSLMCTFIGSPGNEYSLNNIIKQNGSKSKY